MRSRASVAACAPSAAPRYGGPSSAPRWSSVSRSARSPALEHFSTGTGRRCYCSLVQATAPRYTFAVLNSEAIGFVRLYHGLDRHHETTREAQAPGDRDQCDLLPGDDNRQDHRRSSLAGLPARRFSTITRQRSRQVWLAPRSHTRYAAVDCIFLSGEDR